MLHTLFADFGGAGLAFLGGAIAAILCCIGSAKGTGMVGEAVAGLLSDDPSASGKCILYQVMPGTQGLYGVVVFFLTVYIGMGGGNFEAVTLTKGLSLFVACMPMAFGGLFSALYQGRVAANCINLVAKQPENSSRGMMHVVIVEFYAILPLLTSILIILNIQ